MESKLNQVKREIGPSLEIQFLKILQPTILKIFLYFLVALRKRKTLFKVKLTEYWKAVKDIKVTHSPRFEISVREDAETSFFENWDKFVAFKQQSKEEKQNIFKNFLKNKKEGQNLWYVQSTDGQAEPMLFEDLKKNFRVRF